MTTVAVGQPFDTVKTIVQAEAKGGAGPGTFEVARRVVAESGVFRGLWRGSLPLVLGGTRFAASVGATRAPGARTRDARFMRSAQFGCNDLARDALRESGVPRVKLGGVVDSHVVLAGMCGGLGRAVVEGPTEYFKIRQQVVAEWSARQALTGFGITLARGARRVMFPRRAPRRRRQATGRSSRPSSSGWISPSRI